MSIKCLIFITRDIYNMLVRIFMIRELLEFMICWFAISAKKGKGIIYYIIK